MDDDTIAEDADFILDGAIDLITTGGFYKDMSLAEVITDILAHRYALREHLSEEVAPKETMQ